MQIRLLPLMLLWILSAPTSWAAESMPEPAAPATTQPAPEHLRWLDDVRAQREAWETHRKAMKDASDARLRMLDPTGAALMEEREKETQQFRESARLRAEQQRLLMEKERETYRRELQQWLDQRNAAPYPYMPYDWNNNWFYRGY